MYQQNVKEKKMLRKLIFLNVKFFKNTEEYKQFYHQGDF